jgi:hypothetical protein
VGPVMSVSVGVVSPVEAIQVRAGYMLADLLNHRMHHTVRVSRRGR